MAATPKVLASCGEDPLVRVDGLAITEDENNIRRLLVIVKSAKAGVSEGSISKEVIFGILLPERELVAGGNAIERHGVQCSRFGAKWYGARRERGKRRERKQEE